MVRSTEGSRKHSGSTHMERLVSAKTSWTFFPLGAVFVGAGSGKDKHLITFFAGSFKSGIHSCNKIVYSKSNTKFKVNVPVK